MAGIRPSAYRLANDSQNPVLASARAPCPHDFPCSTVHLETITESKFAAERCLMGAAVWIPEQDRCLHRPSHRHLGVNFGAACRIPFKRQPARGRSATVAQSAGRRTSPSSLPARMREGHRLAPKSHPLPISSAGYSQPDWMPFVLCRAFCALPPPLQIALIPSRELVCAFV